MPMSRRGPLTSTPPTVIRPQLGSMSPPINFNKVDFPHPLGPTRETNCPGETEKLTSRNASTSTVPRRVRNTLATFSISIGSVRAPALLCLCRDSVLSMKPLGCCSSKMDGCSWVERRDERRCAVLPAKLNGICKVYRTPVVRHLRPADECRLRVPSEAALLAQITISASKAVTPC